MPVAEGQDTAADRLKPEAWDLSVGALGVEASDDVNGMMALDSSAAAFDANSEDSTCDPDGARGGDDAAPASDVPEAGKAEDDDSELPDTGSTPDLQAKGTAKCRAGRRRTSKYCGVCSANRRNQWQARILMHGKVTHLGYFDTEEEAARVYDIVSLSLHREKANTNFPLSDYTSGDYAQRASKLCGLSREDLQRSLGVKPIHKTSRYNGVSKKRGKWVAKVMIDKKLVYHASFEDEKEAALAYDAAVRRLKPNKAHAYVNFVEPASADAANMNQSYAARQQQFVPGQQARVLPGQAMMMMGRNGDAPMSGTTPVNHWPQLLGRMPFHPMPAHNPDTSMMMQQHPMVGQQVIFDTKQHGVDNPQQVPGSSNGHIMHAPPGLAQQSRLGTPMSMQQQSMDPSEHWAQETYGSMDQMSNMSSQWPAWRGMPHMNGNMAAHIGRSDGMPMQIPHPAQQRPVMWDGAMSLMKMNPAMDSMNRREPIRSHVQALVQGSSLESMMNDRQQSSGSTWSSQFSVNPNLADEVASSTMGNRGFMPGGWA